VVSDNQITTFPSLSEELASNLQMFNLRENELTTIYMEDILPYKTLHTLDLANNHITTMYEFPLSTKHDSFTLYLTTNPLYCDENIMWLKKMVAPQLLHIDAEPCFQPLEYTGVRWEDINIKKGGCPSPLNILNESH